MPEATALVAQSALPAGGRVIGESLKLTVLPARAVLVLKLSPRALETLARIRIAGRKLPIAQNRWEGEDPVHCRIAPDCWWLLSALHDAADLAEALRAGCGKRSHAVADVSDACVTIALEGPLAIEVLARGCGLDFAVAAFPVDACTRTLLAGLPVMLRRTEAERFEIIADRSQAAWLSGWIADAIEGIPTG